MKKEKSFISSIIKSISFMMALIVMIFTTSLFSSNVHAETLGKDFFVVKITTENLPYTNDTFDVSSLTNFKQVSEDDAMTWSSPDSGNSFLIYKSAEPRALMYMSGYKTKVSLQNSTNKVILDSQDSYYYTASKLPPVKFEGGTGVESDPYLIKTKEQLTRFSNIVNGLNGETKNLKACAKLVADIDLEGSQDNQWIPMGNVIYKGEYIGAYAGDFDGNWHTISGLYINDSTLNNAGLFGFAFAGKNTYKIHKLTVEGTIVGNINVAGIVANLRDATIEDCLSNVTVTGNTNVGGIAGATNTNESSIYRCSNYGTITATSTKVGGIVGAVQSLDAERIIENCYNAGTVICEGQGTSASDVFAGGIIGSSVGNLTISNCHNYAPVVCNVSSATGVGAIAGALTSNNYDGSFATISNCVTVHENNMEAVGEKNLNNETGASNSVVNTYAFTIDGFKIQDGFELFNWDFNDVWEMGSTFPILRRGPFHDHNLSYTASGATITATCSAEGCPLDNKQATLTLVAPTELAYDGTAKVATFANGYNQNVFANPVIKYYKGTEEVTSCINAGDYVAKVTYGDATAQVSFTITTISMADYTLALSANTLTYSGVEQTVVTTVRLGDGPILTEGTDYTVSGNVATNVGEYTVTVTGKDNFEGELTATFNIVAANIRGVSVNAPEGGFDDNYFYVVTTWEKTGIFAWTGNGAYFGEWPGTEMTAVGNGMFKIAYPEFKSGDTTIYFIFNDATGERVGHQTADLKYSKHAALSSLYYVDANCAVTFDPRYQNGAEITLLSNSADIDSVVFAELNLVEGTDYTVVYKSLTGTTIDKPVLPGSYIISITGKGNFEGTVTKEFTLVHEHDLSCTASGDTITATCSAIGCPLTEGTATLTIKAPTSLVYDGNAKSASLSQYDATVFNPGAIKYYKGDEEVAAEDVKNVGTYVAKVTSNELTIEVAFEITVASLDGYTLTLSADTLTYNAEEQTVITTVRKTDGPILTEDKDYTVSGNKGTNADEYTVTVTAKGNYAGTLTATFTIEPANIQGTSVDAPEGGFDDNYFYVVTPWAKTNIYAWTDASGEYFGNWPGTEMTSVGNGMFKIAYPALKGNDTSIKFIFNNNTGSKQTSDLGYSKTEALGSVYYVTDGGATTSKLRYQNGVVITVSEDTGNVESITFGTNVLVLDVDYTITYKDLSGNPVATPTAAGNYTSVITGIGNYTGTVEKALTITHIHNFTYVANGNKITASCGADCSITTGLEVIMEAPANLVYDGDTKKIGFTNGYNSEVFQGLVIKYYKGTEEVECKNAGTYVCKATIGGVTAQLEFTIEKAESNPVAQDYDTYYGKKLSEIILDEGWAWDNPNEYVGNVGDHYYSATYTPEDTQNYKTKTMELLVTVVIAIPDYTLPTGLKVLINKTLADVTLPAGFSWKNATQNVGEEVGEKTFKATYTPEDTENYEIVENIDVTVLVYAHEHSFTYTASGATIIAK